MQSKSSDNEKVLLTLQSINETIEHLIEWNQNVVSSEFYYESPTGMQLLAANCTLITAIGEGVNRINHILPEFLGTNFPDTPWREIIGMRNRIAHGYFELDAEIMFDSIKNDFPALAEVIQSAITLCL